MKISYLVASVATTNAKLTAKVDGEDTEVIVPILEVELLDDAGKHGTLTLRFRTADEKAFAQAKYVQGERTEIDLGDAPTPAAAE